MKYLLRRLLILSLAFSMVFPCVCYADKKDSSTEQTETAASETAETEEVATILPTDVVSTEDIVLYSKACVVMDVDTGQFLYYKNPDDKHYPASITKVMSALVLLENANLKDKVTFTQDCWDGIDIWTDMNIAMSDGEVMTVKQCLYAMLLASANEVCNGIAIHVSGSVKEFCKLMNQKAEELGCLNTHFVNPNGLHNKKHYVTAYDMALIAQAAFENEDFRKICGTTEFTVKKTNLRKEGFELYNKHQMLMWTKYHYDGCLGGKTGYTPDAGNTLVTYAEKNGHTLVCITLEAYNGHLYPDTTTALDYVFDNYDTLVSTVPEIAHKTTKSSTSKKGSDTTDAEETDAAAENSEGDLTAETANIQLQDETEVSTGSMSSVKDILTSGQSPKVIADKLYQKCVIKITRLFTKYMPYSIIAVIVLFIVLTLLLVWIKRLLTRKYHRSKYKKLRKKRLNEKE